MVHNILATTFAVYLLVFSLLSTISTSAFPPCGNIPQPCSCPTGATFRNITTYATIGAKATDIGSITNDCTTIRDLNSAKVLIRVHSVFSTTWFDLILLSTTGVDNVVGATRTFSIGDNVNLTEKAWPASRDKLLLSF